MTLWCLVAQSCLTLCDPMDCSPPGPSVHGIAQARIRKWVTIPFSKGSSWSRDQTCTSCIGWWVLYHWATREAQWNMDQSLKIVPYIYWQGKMSPTSHWVKQRSQPLQVQAPSYLLALSTHRETERGLWSAINRREIQVRSNLWADCGCLKRSWEGLSGEAILPLK